MNRQVLILNITRMGDLVQMGTLLSRLQEEWPGVAVDVVIDRRFAAVASLLPGLRDIITYDFHALIDDSRAAVKSATALYADLAAWARPLADRHYHRLINLTFNRSSALLASYIGASDIRGARCAWDGESVIDNPWMAYFTDMHHFRALNRFNLVDVYALGGSGPGTHAPLSVRVTPTARDWAKRFLAAAPEASQEWIAVQAGASDAMKAWRPEHFGRTLAHLSARWKGGIVLIGTPAEQDTLAQVLAVYREAGGRNPVLNAAGQTTVEQLVGLLAECRLLLTNDTGPMHLAVGVQVPVIDLSVGHVDFRETGPYGAGHWVVQPELECAPCGFDQVCAHHSCKDRLPVAMVADLLLHVLAKGDCPPDAPGYRLYRSSVDEDRLGNYCAVGTEESSDLDWYSRYWRRYWYETLTHTVSHIPSDSTAPQNAAASARHLAGMMPELDRLCRQADAIVQAAAQAARSPGSLQALQREQTALRERVVRLGMAHIASSPATASFMRFIHHDHVRGLDRMAQHHALAYRQWRRHLTEIHRQLTRNSSKTTVRRVPMFTDSSIAHLG
ncbi:MAG: Glycosyltransferase family 9 protein [Nitrospira sp.]|nr:MAG: Glycosyltransferase family 9 protein [Nitrospira sp.]